jgi:hypothetical protein
VNEKELNAIENTIQAYSFARTIEELQLRKMEYELCIDDRFTVISVRFQKED